MSVRNGGTPDAPGIAATVCSGDGGCMPLATQPQKKVRVTVAVDGSTAFAPNNQLTHTYLRPTRQALWFMPPPRKTPSSPAVCPSVVPLPRLLWPALARRPVVRAVRAAARPGDLIKEPAMPKETDTNLRDFTAPRPPQKSNLGLPFVCVLFALLAFWWVLIVRDPFSRPEPVPVLADLEPAAPAAYPRPIRPPPSGSPPRSHRARDFRAVAYYGHRVAVDRPCRCFNFGARGGGNLCGQ